jgi:hypothetical protein
MDVSGQLQVPAASSPGNFHQYLLITWLDGLQIISGRFRGEKNILLQPENQQAFVDRPARVVSKSPTAVPTFLDLNISHASSLITHFSLKEQCINFNLPQFYYYLSVLMNTD